MKYESPQSLVTALHRLDPGARECLWELLRPGITGLLERLLTRHGLTHSCEQLTEYALHSAETFLRTRPSSDFDEMSWESFRAALLLHEAKTVFRPPQTISASDSTVSPPIPETPYYRSETFQQPYERVGDYWFSGDWIGGHVDQSGALWILVADVTGHGYPAYLVSKNLPTLWSVTWASIEAPSPDPVEVLCYIHDTLEKCLPDGIYIEAALLKFYQDGRVVILSAGGTRIVLKRKDGLTTHVVPGTWLGFLAPSEDSQQQWLLDVNDELLIGSDGLFDHLPKAPHEHLSQLIDLETRGPVLYEMVKELLSRRLDEKGQKDDISMVTFHRCGAQEGNADV
ncbi:MAG: PP2C family protein-serine/threonine phosphatase [Gemmataceae bacterium]